MEIIFSIINVKYLFGGGKNKKKTAQRIWFRNISDFGCFLKAITQSFKQRPKQFNRLSLEPFVFHGLPLLGAALENSPTGQCFALRDVYTATLWNDQNHHSSLDS